MNESFSALNQNKMLLRKGFSEQAGSYLIKAAILTASLTLIGMIAPAMPAPLLPPILIAYAIISTIGALYYTMVDRMHKQVKYTKSGVLSRLNRKWTLWLSGFFILSLVSGSFFMLESPKWDLGEWLLAWIAIPLFLLVFKSVQHHLKREYATEYLKAHAMRWTFWIVGALLCLAYMLISSQFSPESYSTLRETFDSTPTPYENSPSALMSNVGELSAFMDSMTTYAIVQLSSANLFIGLICKLVVYASVFFGLVNQLGFCLLGKDEVKGTFQHLPAIGETRSSSPILKKYVLIIAVISIVFTAAFLSAEFEIAKMRMTNGYSAMESFIHEQKESAIMVADGKLEELKEQQREMMEKEQQLIAFYEERNKNLLPLIDTYYDHCRDRIDAYIDWYEGPEGAIARFLKGIGNPFGNRAMAVFEEKVTSSSETIEIERIYCEYRERLRSLVAELMSQKPLEGEMIEYLSLHPAFDDLDLWRSLQESNITEEVLLNTEKDMSKEKLTAKIEELIERARKETLSFLETRHFSVSAIN